MSLLFVAAAVIMATFEFVWLAEIGTVAMYSRKERWYGFQFGRKY
jgi:hypothetical protein